MKLNDLPQAERTQDRELWIIDMSRKRVSVTEAANADIWGDAEFVGCLKDGKVIVACDYGERSD